MKIETKEKEWQPIVVTIETREEAKELYLHLVSSCYTLATVKPLFNLVQDRLK